MVRQFPCHRDRPFALDVVAWHGNYAPYKYDLATFSPVGALLFDHPDPSIFTVLTAPSGEEGTANIDFVIFPPRWLVARIRSGRPGITANIMSEFMGLIHGQYDAKEEGLCPGGISLHNLMLAHGPDAPGFEKASRSELKPVKLDNTMAFMFETRFPQMLTRYGAELETRQDIISTAGRPEEAFSTARSRATGLEISSMSDRLVLLGSKGVRHCGRAGRGRVHRCWSSAGERLSSIAAGRHARPCRCRPST